MNRKLIYMHLDQATEVTKPKFKLSSFFTGLLILMIITFIISFLVH
jgi:hypothetical protein